ncbi:PIN domain-containing protein [Lysinibacillus xylanilyticus]|uniref:PIN domain-containing protein n=1 Tax=Lysinibacillus xylanilyticus TaxID=582475 RepID=UPI002B24A1CC|nr:PIN domain-containing protein [Lysinibacillus xylanilyticus]MEB2301597.1 PIN domain-containing protein [Lysinibacillus xylanilyticus]
MKYLLMDTNIFIDMIVSRDSSNSADSFELLKKLLDHEQVQIILPAIVETEIKRHIESEIQKVGDLINSAKSSIERIYWINHVDEMKKFNEQIHPLKNTLKSMVDEFKQNKMQYINDAKEKIAELMNYKNVNRIEENEKLLLNVQKRKIHKLCPFHIKDKESWADAMIIETLINIRDFIDINADDQIYFITRNHEDFSKSKTKQEKELIHPDIMEELYINNLDCYFNYRIHYTKTLVDDFSEEAIEADIYQLLVDQENELREDTYKGYLQDILNMRRESVGLMPLLSGETYIEHISENAEVTELLERIIFFSELENDIENVLDKYEQLIDDLDKEPFQKIISSIIAYNSYAPFLHIDYKSYYTEDKVRENIIDFINSNLCPLEALDETLNSVMKKDYFEVNNRLLSFKDLNGNKFELWVQGELDPRDNDFDTLFIYLEKNGDSISTGEIEVYYGFINENEDGGAADSSEQQITYRLEDVIDALDNTIQGNFKLVQKYSDYLDALRNILI